VNRQGVERFSALQAAASEGVIRTRVDLEAAFTALSSEVKNELASLRRGPSWKSALFETFHGKFKQDSYDWFFALDCFFEVAQDLRDPTSRVTFAATLLRNDALKWWWQAQTSGTTEEHDLRHHLRAPLKMELKQIKSAKAYSSIFRTVAGLERDRSVFC
jgi:hypothetical protein